MRCREFEDRLNDLLDQRLALERDEFLLRHAAECGTCRGLMEGQAALFAGLELLDSSVPSNFAFTVLVQAELVPAYAVEALPRRKSWLRVMAGLVSVAALVLVAVAIGFTRSGQRPDEPIANRPQPAKQMVASAPTKPAPSHQVIAPTRGVATKQSPPAAVPSHDSQDYEQYRETINSLAAQFPQAVEKIDEVQQATPGIRPIRASFSMAIGTLQRTVPNRRREPRPAKADGSFVVPAQIVIA